MQQEEAKMQAVHKTKNEQEERSQFAPKPRQGPKTCVREHHGDEDREDSVKIRWMPVASDFLKKGDIGFIKSERYLCGSTTPC